MTIHISKGNKKIDRGGAIFDLPIGTTCIGAGECRKWCSRIKNEWMGKGYPTVKNQVENLEATYSPTFVADVVAWIRANNIKFFRFHDAGDFFQNWYVEKCAQIARQCADVKFFSFTKSLQLNFKPLRDLPNKNWTLIYSYGGKFNKRIMKKKNNYADVVDQITEKTIEKGEFVCPEVRVSGKATEKFCGYNCSYCISDQTPKHQIKVVFLKKKLGWSGSKLVPRPPIILPTPSRQPPKNPRTGTTRSAA